MNQRPVLCWHLLQQPWHIRPMSHSKSSDIWDTSEQNQCSCSNRCQAHYKCSLFIYLFILPTHSIDCYFVHQTFWLALSTGTSYNGWWGDRSRWGGELFSYYWRTKAHWLPFDLVLSSSQKYPQSNNGGWSLLVHQIMTNIPLSICYKTGSLLTYHDSADLSWSVPVVLVCQQSWIYELSFITIHTQTFVFILLLWKIMWWKTVIWYLECGDSIFNCYGYW